MPNLAVTLTGLYQPHSFRVSLLGLSRRHISPRAKDSVWVWTDGGHVHGIASVRPRSGVKSWELSHLYADSTSEVSVTRLLEKVAVAAASNGAERIFLRVESDSDIVPIARFAGFYPCFGEALYHGYPSGEASEHSLFDADSRLRKRGKEDDYDLFRLYNAATPVKVRQLVGMTFDQWKASHERSPGRYNELVFETEGSIQGWLGTASRAGTGNLAVTLHPDYVALTPNIVDAGLKRLSKSKTVMAMVPDYTPILASVLEDRGMGASGDFTVLVKSTARTVKELVPARSSLAAVE